MKARVDDKCHAFPISDSSSTFFSAPSSFSWDSLPINTYSQPVSNVPLVSKVRKTCSAVNKAKATMMSIGFPNISLHKVTSVDEPRCEIVYLPSCISSRSFAKKESKPEKISPNHRGRWNKINRSSVKRKRRISAYICLKQHKQINKQTALSFY